MSKLNAAPLPDVADDWYAAQFNETRGWNLPVEYRPYVERIMGVYFYDATERTYCCEITPSYCLRFLYNYVVFTSDTPDDVREELSERFSNDFAHDGEDLYMHCRAVDGIPSSRKRHYGATSPDCEDESDRQDEVREHYQGNCPF